jgi:alpha-L-arabinofuranosidase
MALGLFAALGIPAGAQRTAAVSVNANHPLATVSAMAYGVGISVYDNNFAPADLPGKLKVAGVTALRFPGGSYSDIYHWQTNAATAGQKIYINSNDTFDNFMTRDVLPSGAQAILTVNYGSNAAGDGGGDPAEAAAWVRFANIEKKWMIQYWEIGNEIGGNGYFSDPGWELDLHAPYNHKRAGEAALSQEAYGRNTLEFVRAMKAVDPSIKIGVGVELEDKNRPSHNGPLLKQVGAKIDFVIVHWYPQGSTSDLSVTDQILPQTADLRNQLQQYAGPAARNLPIAVTETNGGGPGAARALFATDTFLTWFEAGAFNVVWQEMHPGFFSDGKDAPLDTPTEAYYGLQLAALAARPGDTLVETTSSAPMLIAHGVKRQDGGAAVVLINKHPNQPYTVNVSLSGTAVSSIAIRYDFGRANFSFNSPWASSGVQKGSVKAEAGTFQITVPLWSETAIVLPPR